MAGEMTAPVDEDTWSFHAFIRDLVDGELRPFDQYRGPYIRTPEGAKLWIIEETSKGCCGHTHSEGVAVYNEQTDEKSDVEPVPYGNEDMAHAMLEDMVAQVYPLKVS
jgi:hypothetical protein